MKTSNAYALKHGCCYCAALPVADEQNACERCLEIKERYPLVHGDGVIARMRAEGVVLRPAMERVLDGGRYRHFDDDLSPDAQGEETEEAAKVESPAFVSASPTAVCRMDGLLPLKQNA